MTSLTRTLLTMSLLTAGITAEGYQAVAPRALRAGEIPVSAPGNYSEAGKTYVLTQDVSAPGSAIFLGKDVTLDLNGYTITYAAAPYEAIPNGSFENGMQHWDCSKAPNAKAVDRRWLNPMVGDLVCLLPQGEEIASPYITLPIANRAYYAMVAVASQQMAVGVWVEDEEGNEVACTLQTSHGERKTCPEPNRAPKLGGGVVFALIFNKPAGKYRIRVKANNRDCIIDDVDIRPAMDTGIGVVESILPWAYYKCVLDGDDTAFFDFSPLVSQERSQSIPIVSGDGSITIRNGTIRSGAKGIRTWGLQSTAKAVRVNVENMHFIASGINANAMRFAHGSITNCSTDIDSPWIIDRHRQGDYAINLTGGSAGSRVVDNVFLGGQGQLSIRGTGGEVANNLFVNKQRVVNHYSLGAGSGTKIHHNRFHPEQGSAILIYGARDTEVYENDFVISASPPVNEYSQEIYSVSAIRITDYNRTSGDSICVGNRIHHNRFTITGRSFPEAHKDYKPTAHGIYMSVGGGINEIDNNVFAVTHENPPNTNERGDGAFAIFIGGSDQGGLYHHNHITSNVAPVWVANTYGPVANATFHDNTFVGKPADGIPYTPIWLGWWKNQTTNVGFYSNHFEGVPFAVKINDYQTYTAGYRFGWTLRVVAAPGSRIVVASPDGTAVTEGVADSTGTWAAHLAEFDEHGAGRKGTQQLFERQDRSAYTVTCAGATRTVTMTQDRTIDFAKP